MSAGVTPAARPRPGSGPVRRASGFTLVELMVVLAIVGVAGAVVALSLQPGEASLHRQADGFALHLQRAREEAILGGRGVRVVADAAGYAFHVREGREWHAPTAPALAPRGWQGDVAPRLAPREPQAAFVFDPTGAAEPRTLVLALGAHAVAVAVDAGGRVRVDDAPR